MTSTQITNLVFQLNEEVSTLLKKPIVSIKVNPSWRAYKANGQYNGYTKTMSISKYLTKDQDIYEVILHELCHVYTPGDNHGPLWKAVAQQVGSHYNITITRCKNREKNIPASSRPVIATATCSCCGYVWKYYRRTKIYQSNGEGWYCASCGTPKGKLIFEKIK